MLKTEIIKKFLVENTIADLASLYSHDMECQVNVAKDGGQQIKGEYKGKQWSGFTDGKGQTWKSFRIPYNANTDPTYEDKDIKFSLAQHAEGVGMTGWDWKNKTSKWIAYDFDAIVGHSEKHPTKLTVDELNEVRDNALKLPWTTVRKSTSGKGLHIYVFLDSVPTANHTEHAALGRSILHYMSAKTGFPFHERVDICGGNMWVWHRKMKDTPGLSIVKSGDTLHHIPPNWRDHLQVVSGKRKRILPDFSNESFDDLSSQKQHTSLDEDHRKLINYLDELGASFWWDEDHHMLVCHTHDLRTAHVELGLRGVFDTAATGTGQGVDHNCFMYPLRHGAWAVRRYGEGVNEVDTWDQDGKGWTRCYFNRKPDLKTVSKAYNGIEHPSGGFVFKRAEDASKAAQQLNVDLGIPNILVHRETKLKEHKDGRLIAEVKRNSDDPPDQMKSWLTEKANKFTKIYDEKVNEAEVLDVENYDDLVRHVVTESGSSLGWTIRSEKQWTDEPLQHVGTCLRSLGLKAPEIQTILGNNIFKPWQMVVKPFEPEYVGDRCWNRSSAQFRYPPNLGKDNFSCPTWNMIIDHVGFALDDYIKEHKWCAENNLLTGGDYIRCWVASLFQFPYEPLPYLFFWSEEQSTGKSMLHEALGLLITQGYVRADHALQTTFNGELERAVLCVVEETDLQRNKRAYNMIKDYVTGLQISLHVKGSTPVMIPNTTHWIQCANEATACPLFKGDTRVTVINVPPIVNHESKRELLARLRKEASDFLGSMLKLELPKCDERLNVPVIETHDKRVIARTNETILDMFIEECCSRTSGHMVSIGEFYSSFIEWVDASERYQWTKQKVSKTIHPSIPKGRNPRTATWCYGNLTLDKDAKPLEKLVLDRRGDTLVPENKR